MSGETALYLRVDGETRRIPGARVLVGRSRTCDVHVDRQGVSRRHCEIVLDANGALLRDLGSTHGTWTGDGRLEGETRLVAGAVFLLGAHGPRIEVADAVVDGRRVVGDVFEACAATATAPVPRVAVAAAAPRGRFLAGLACGVAAGLAVGIAALSFIA
jgi:predicted component of type VI protein secretion system